MGRPQQLEEWLRRYGRAWETKDPQAAVELFAEDATYRETPFDEPMRGHDAIRWYWSQIEGHQEDIEFGSEMVALVEGGPAVVRWWASYRNVKTGDPTRLDGVFILEFDPEGLCRSLREWWHAYPHPSF